MNAVASLLKKFFRELEEPLFTAALYDDFIAAARTTDEELRLSALRALVGLATIVGLR